MDDNLQGEDWGRKVLWNYGNLPQHYMVSQSRRPWHKSSSLWKPQVS